jgi:polar amino acid transport system substrate-binding protein
LKEASVKNPGLSFAGLSCDEVVEMLPQMLTRMQESSDRIGQIVMDLKDFVREQNDKTFTVVDLNQVVRTSCRMMENTIRNSTLSFDFQPEPSPVLFLGDFQRIEQVVVNLIQNACQALTDMQQEIVLRTYFDGNGCASLQITDQGCGISADDLPKITNPFFTTKRSTGGTGLGLSVSVSILQDHAANFDVESTVGHGSSVTISFPAINEENNL